MKHKTYEAKFTFTTDSRTANKLFTLMSEALEDYAKDLSVDPSMQLQQVLRRYEMEWSDGKTPPHPEENCVDTECPEHGTRCEHGNGLTQTCYECHPVDVAEALRREARRRAEAKVARRPRHYLCPSCLGPLDAPARQQCCAEGLHRSYTRHFKTPGS